MAFLAAVLSLPAYLIYGMTHPPEIDGPKICPLPDTAEQLLKLRLAVSPHGGPDLGALGAWAQQAGHGSLVAEWARTRTMATSQGGMFDLAPIMSWVDLGTRGSLAAMQAAMAQITNARPNPKVRISQWNPEGTASPPPPDHNAQARAQVTTTIMLPAMLINGRIDEVLGRPADDTTFRYGDDWGVRFQLSRGEYAKAIALYRTHTVTAAISGLRAIVNALVYAGNYEAVDALRREEEVLFAEHPFVVVSAFRWIDRVRPLHEALRRDDIEAAEAYARSLESDAKTFNDLTTARSALLAYHLRRADWRRAEPYMSTALHLFGRPPQEAWLIGADTARTAGEPALAARWVAEAKATFCASNPNRQAPKIGGVNPDVLRFLHSLYVYTAVGERLLPAQALMRPPAWAM